MAFVFNAIMQPIRSLLGCPKPTETDDDDAEDVDYIPPPIIDVCDQTAVRHALDETCASYITDELGLEEDEYSSNLKLQIMAFACAVAMVGQFFPIKKFWFGRYLVGCCCAIYFVSSGILQLVYWYVDANIIMKSLPDPDNDNKVLQLRTELPPYETKYKIIVETLKDGELIGKPIEATTDIGEFFTSDGQFYEAALDKVIQKLVVDFTNKKKK